MNGINSIDLLKNSTGIITLSLLIPDKTITIYSLYILNGSNTIYLL